jgi:hypothetical protein
MNKIEKQDQQRMIQRVMDLGFTFDEVQKLRRISLTLRRWYELECGTSNDHGTDFAIERGRKERGEFISDPDGKPFLRTEYNYRLGYQVRHYPTADRESGAIKRLKAIVAPHSRKVTYFLQTDPRGCALYIVPKKDYKKYGHNRSLDCVYSSVGIAVY